MYYSTHYEFKNMLENYGVNSYLPSGWTIADSIDKIRRAQRHIDSALGQSFTVLGTAMATAQASSSITIATNITTESRIGIQVYLTGADTDAAGTITVTGTSGGAANQSEDLVFTGASWHYTKAPYHTITVTASGLTCHVNVYKLEIPDIINELSGYMAGGLFFDILRARQNIDEDKENILAKKAGELIASLKSGKQIIIDQDGDAVILDKLLETFTAKTIDWKGEERVRQFTTYEDAENADQEEIGG
ncbi:hypothetical protein A2368_01510 [Candidatus Collierbacteria bacterium RIFOXYB1_FULL_49_13]|uniref:Uncharacterized protein n=1 Tax=Candidatus Collierbacteria bacterium RIFOXYB1_FULL_49_13 TaxID=1817728 RepID=A0A1F5FGJ8_9BACT|nr:MAG: hypothetical protein A2368_01510 [Candidatus Collierbacteria bacterium RIFOXYB1_FULL_49_13]